MSTDNILKQKLVTNKYLYDCCLIIFKKYPLDNNQLLFYLIKNIKYDKLFCNRINKILKNKNLDDKMLFRTIKRYIYVHIYRKLLQYIYLYEQNIYRQNIHEQNIYEHWNLFKKAKKAFKKIGNDTKKTFNIFDKFRKDAKKGLDKVGKDVKKSLEKVGKDAKKGLDKVGKDVKKSLEKVGNDTKKDFDKFGKDAKKGFDKFGKDAKKDLEKVGKDVKDKIVGYVNKLDNSRKCLQSGNLECAFNNLKDIATDIVPAINIIDKLARGEKVSPEEIILLAISVAPIPGAGIVGAAGKMVGKSVAKTVVKSIMEDPKINSKISDVINNAIANNKNIKPEDLKKIVADHVNNITLDEMNKNNQDKAIKEKFRKEKVKEKVKEKAEKEKAEKEKADRYNFNNNLIYIIVVIIIISIVIKKFKLFDMLIF